MSQYIKEFGIINESVTDQIIEHIKNDKQDMELSQLYSSVEDAKFIDKEKRLSVFKTINDVELFSLFDELIVDINSLDKSNDYQIVKNNITYIKYEKGGFFDIHEDYLSFTSNIIEEYTMIICEDATCLNRGGETVFEINPFFTYESKQSVIPKNCLIFRKDLKHAGKLVEEGYKNIIMANILCTPKKDKNGQIVIVTFPDNDEKFIFAASKLEPFKNNFLSKYIEFNKITNKIVLYEEKSIPIEGFNILYKIFNRCYITIDEYEEAKDCILYYNILVGDIMISFHETKTIEDKTIDKLFDDQIIICENSEKFDHVCSLVKDSDLELQYLPFRIIFAEGSLNYGGEMTGTPTQLVNMTPVWFSISENDNIMFYMNLVTTNTEIEEIKTLNGLKNNYIKDGYENGDYDRLLQQSIIDIECDYDLKEDKIGYNEDFPYSDDKYYFNGDMFMENTQNSDILLKIFERNSLDGQFVSNFNREIKNKKLIGIDENNKIAIDPKNMDNIIKILNDMNFINLIKSNINNIALNLQLPQQKENFEENFCNEDVYGSFNIVMIQGFIKLDNIKK
jgi:hypothetical protein